MKTLHFQPSTSKAKSKAKSGRSTFLKALMKTLSTGQGDKVVQSYANGDQEEFRRAWADVGQKLGQKLVQK